jgi:NADPH:quinone reductase-like Zn-dependent oxidoreductase
MAGMRAWEVGSEAGPSNLRLVDRPDPVPGPGEVLLRPRAIALNYRDWLVVSGRYQRQLAAGSIPCSDAAGEIVAVGPGVRDIRPGDRVTSTCDPAWRNGPCSRAAIRSTLGTGLHDGVLAESVVLPATGVVPVPTGYSDEQAATLPCAGLTAWHALFEEVTIRPGGTVLTLGTGGVSLFAVQFAAAAGFRVFATSGHEAKRPRLKALGAADTLNYREVPQWGERARDWSGGEGVDLVVEVGGSGTLEQSLKAVRPGGTVCLIGNVADAAPVNLMPVLMRNIRVQGIVVGSRAMFERMNRAIERWRIAPVIDRTFPFAQAPAAFDYLAQGRHVGKIVVSV